MRTDCLTRSITAKGAGGANNPVLGEDTLVASLNVCDRGWAGLVYSGPVWARLPIVRSLFPSFAAVDGDDAAGSPCDCSFKNVLYCI